MFHFSVIYQTSLPAGYTCLGSVNVPVVKDGGYICADFQFWFFTRKVAWRIV
jgi:hypothetical protein